tara:strand:- start:103 stop:630 length:528 start_codon:yes stop_codon:yes gene_type:complete
MTKKADEIGPKERFQITEGWRKQIITSAHMFANDGMKALILLNGGAFIALPALKSLSTDVNITTLFPAVVCFMVGLIAALVTVLLAYASLTAAAHQYSAVSRSWEEHIDAATTTDKLKHQKAANEIKRSNTSSERWYKVAIFSEIVASVTAVISLIMFILGGYQGIVAFYPIPNG